MAAGMKWNGKKFEKFLRHTTADGLNRGGTFYHAKCQEVVGRPNTGVKVKVKRQAPGGNKSTRTIYPNPSKAGEPPRKRTGFGQRNIVKEFNREKMYVRVGVGANAFYMFLLEIGTRFIERRPWLVSTLKKHLDTIVNLMASGK